MEYVGIFYGHLVHFTVFSYIFWTFGIVCGKLVYFSHFGILYKEKSGNPVMQRELLVASSSSRSKGCPCRSQEYISEKCLKWISEAQGPILSQQSCCQTFC
jgi:hypothetical protein